MLFDDAAPKQPQQRYQARHPSCLLTSYLHGVKGGVAGLESPGLVEKAAAQQGRRFFLSRSCGGALGEIGIRRLG